MGGTGTFSTSGTMNNFYNIGELIMPVSEITISQGRNQYKVNLQGEPTWFVLMWGWWPDRGNIPSSRWQRIESVPKEVEEDFQKLREGKTKKKSLKT